MRWEDIIEGVKTRDGSELDYCVFNQVFGDDPQPSHKKITEARLAAGVDAIMGITDTEAECLVSVMGVRKPDISEAGTSKAKNSCPTATPSSSRRRPSWRCSARSCRKRR